MSNSALFKEKYKFRLPILLLNLIQLISSLDALEVQNWESKCLTCIRNTTNQLNGDVTRRCEGYYCGPLQLSYTYWAEAGKPGNKDGIREFEKCAKELSCAEQTVKLYFKRFKRDCNNDGQIDCLDMSALHKGGPMSCSSDWFYKSRYWVAFNRTSCMSAFEEPTNVKQDSNKQLISARKPSRILKNQTLTPECLDCICEATSNCNLNTNNCVGGSICGPFAISLAYWRDARSPGASWSACTKTKACSSVTIRNYMERYKRDCNEDGYITCEDYAAIHRAGPRVCSSKELLKDNYWNKFLACRANQMPSNDVNMVKVNQNPEELRGNSIDIAHAPPLLEPTTSTKPSEQNIISITLPDTTMQGHSQVTGRPNSKYDFTPSPPFIHPSSFSLTPIEEVSRELMMSSPTTAKQDSTSFGHTSSEFVRSTVVSSSKLPYPMSSWTQDKQEFSSTRSQDSSINLNPIDSYSTTPQQLIAKKKPANEDKRSTATSPTNISSTLAPNQSKGSNQKSELEQSLQDFPNLSQSGNAGDKNNFDKVVIKIVGSPEFSNSHPPIPDLSGQGSAGETFTNSGGQIRPRGPNMNLNRATSSQNIEPTPKSGISMHQRSTLNNQQDNGDKSVIEPFTSSILSLDQSYLNETGRISSECLECICEASSNCDTSVQCISKQREKNRCGLYMISWNQFQESDILLTVSNPQSSLTKDDASNERLYYECSTDKVCAEKMINLYFEKHQKDCNNDDKIDCYDVAAIHRAGPDNCGSSKLLDSQYWKDFSTCYSSDRFTTQPSQTTSQLFLR